MKYAFSILFFVAMVTHPVHSETERTQPGASQSKSNRAFAALEGVWVVEKVVSAGKTVPKEKLTHEFQFQQPDQLLRKGIQVGKVTGRDRIDEIKLDATKTPAWMDMTRTVGAKKQTVLAIYKIEGDALKICFLRGRNGQPAPERPANFEDSETTKSELIALKRKTKESE